jgi:hypothetical protein
MAPSRQQAKAAFCGITVFGLGQNPPAAGNNSIGREYEALRMPQPRGHGIAFGDRKAKRVIAGTFTFEGRFVDKRRLDARRLDADLAQEIETPW